MKPLVIDDNGQLSLKAAFDKTTMKNALQLTIKASDHRVGCTLRGASGIETTNGPCQISMVIILQVVAFVSCPSNIVEFAEQPAPVSWTVPSLPDYASDIIVKVNLADTISTSPPFIYSFGVRQITYSARFGADFTVTCSFSVTIIKGVSIDLDQVDRILYTQDELSEYLVGSSTVCTHCSRLPTLQTSLNNVQCEGLS